MECKKYILLIFMSLLLTLTMLLKMCECIMEPYTILCDFISMIGGGILCSTIVTWIVEVQNNNKEERNREEQRKYIFSSARNSLIRLLNRELYEISNYYVKYISNYIVEDIKDEMTIQEISKKLVFLLNEIEIAENQEYGHDIKIITPESIKQDIDKKNRLVNNSKIYYQSLRQSLSELSTLYNTFIITGLLNEEKIDFLKALTWNIYDILSCDSETGIGDGLILVYKKDLFEKMCQYFSVFDVLEKDKVQVHYKNVF